MLRGTAHKADQRRRTAILLACATIMACADDPTQPFEPATLTIATDPPGVLAVGDTIALALELRDRHGRSVPTPSVAWESDDPEVVEVGPDGRVAAAGPGRAAVTATVGGASASAQFVVADPEWAVLLTFFRATGGNDWNRPWDLHSHYSEWRGVTVDSAGRVIGIHLRDNNLTGSIPPELGDLTHLQTLNLYGNNLTGRIPPELGRLDNLRTLGLGGNRLGGSIPPELGDIADLEDLSLISNRLRGAIPSELGNLTNLRDLWLGSNELSGPIPPELGRLGNLGVLHLSGNELSGPIPPELSYFV